MGKLGKKSNAEAATAPISVPKGKPGKKGKRDAVQAIAKPVSVKKQKKEVEPVVPKKVEDGKKLKKALQQPPPRKEPEASSSEDIMSSEPEEEKPLSKDKTEEGSEEPQKEKLKGTVSPNAGKPFANALEEETGSEEDDSAEESSDDEPKSAEQNEPGSGSEEDSFEDESGEESEDELLAKTPKKDTDVKMVDVPSANKAEKQASAKSEKKAPKTPAANQSQPSGSKTLFVGNLSFDAGEDDVVEFLKDAGEVVEVRLATHGDGKFRGFGHVEFATVEAAQKALELNGQELLGRAVKLDLARERAALTPQSGKENASQQKGGKGQSQTIFVKGFDKDVEEDEMRSSLEEHFGSCGEITRVSIPMDRESGVSRGIAYVDFQDQDAFSKALELNGSELGGYALTVDEAKPKGDGRDGGRSGGKDRGGRFGGRRGGGRGGGGGRGRGGGGRGRGGGGRRKFGDD